ncbi:regulatory signaling modulator protein AmpE [Pseudidiomarina mangrovi]|uniref:regulatory signaling modulator protein AmpE n=1 Tax=Pseudidiomarina mangrovi TaxID=2487133 RepID=UPI000FCA6AF5|nr:regulatory signaling modulator protein AmpE [Pseudidiomarina mangrovi]
MYLLALLLTYSLERTVQISRNWHWRRLILRWQHWQFANHKIAEFRAHGLGHLVWAIIPALLIGFVLALLGNSLVTFIVSVAGLLLAILLPKVRNAYRGYLAAGIADDRGEPDHVAMAEHARTLRHQIGRDESASVAEVLTYIHLRYYFAVFFYFLLFGITGALVYATIRDMRQPRTSSWRSLHQIIDWLPTRVMGFGFLLVGNFSQGFPIWLNSIGNQPQDNFTVASRLVAAAEPYAAADEAQDAQQTALTTVALLKRNMLFFLVLVAILTIVHWLP